MSLLAKTASIADTFDENEYFSASATCLSVASLVKKLPETPAKECGPRKRSRRNFDSDSLRNSINYRTSITRQLPDLEFALPLKEFYERGDCLFEDFERIGTIDSRLREK